MYQGFQGIVKIFKIVPCVSAKPNTKAKVENPN